MNAQEICRVLRSLPVLTEAHTFAGLIIQMLVRHVHLLVHRAKVLNAQMAWDALLTHCAKKTGIIGLLKIWLLLHL